MICHKGSSWLLVALAFVALWLAGLSVATAAGDVAHAAQETLEDTKFQRELPRKITIQASRGGSGGSGGSGQPVSRGDESGWWPWTSNDDGDSVPALPTERGEEALDRNVPSEETAISPADDPEVAVEWVEPFEPGRSEVGDAVVEFVRRAIISAGTLGLLFFLHRFWSRILLWIENFLRHAAYYFWSIGNLLRSLPRLLRAPLDLLEAIKNLLRKAPPPAEVAQTDNKQEPTPERVDVVEAQAAPKKARVLDSADRLAAEGRYREAIHLVLLRSLEDLRRRRHLTPRPALTSREIIGSARLTEKAKAALAHIVRAVEISHFGGRMPGDAEYRACRESEQRLSLEMGGAG